MKKLEITAYDLALRFTSIKEVKGIVDNPQIMAMLKLDNTWPEHDEVPWCSAFVNYILWLLDLPRTRSLAAISWESIGRRIAITDAIAGFDLVVFKRGTGNQRHVAFFSALNGSKVICLGGNQGDTVGLGAFSVEDITAVIRIYGDEDA